MNGEWTEALLLERAEKYDRRTTLRLGFPETLEALGDIVDKRGLDYGCGTGEFTRTIMLEKRDEERKGEKGPRSIIALDPSQGAIEYARRVSLEQGLGRIKYRNLHTGFHRHVEDGSMDFAVATFVLCTIQRDEEVLKALSNIYGSLVPGAPFVVCDPHPESPGSTFYSSISTSIADPPRTGTPVRVKLTGVSQEITDYWRSEEDYANLLEKAGFEVVNVFEPVLPVTATEEFWIDERYTPPNIVFQAVKPDR